MNYPRFYFADSRGELPWEDGMQHTRQYNGRWYVQIDTPWDGGVALKGEVIIPLIKTLDNRWELPQRNKQEQEISRAVASRSGEITAILVDNLDKPLDDSPQVTLLVKPTGITEEELKQLTFDIGLLALSTSSCVNNQLQAPLDENSGNETLRVRWFYGRGLILSANALLKLASIVQDNWTAIEKRPLRSFVKTLGLVNIQRLQSSPQLLIKAKLEPFRQQALGLTQVESIECVENEFLCYVLDVYLIELAQGLAKSLEQLNIDDTLIPAFSNSKFPSVSEFLKNSISKAKDYNKQKNQERQNIAQRVSRLKDCIDWAKNARHSSFIKNVSTPDEPYLLSQRLSGSPSYGPVFEEYMNCELNHLSNIKKVLSLFRILYKGLVRSTWELYEIWCFTQIYSAFVTNLNLRPVSNNSNLFEAIQIKQGELRIPTNREFKLEGFLDDGSNFNVSLWYQPEEYSNSNLKRIPDIKVNISSKDHIQTYYFDAKYRNYKRQGVRQFVEDVLEVAKNKYLALGAIASFILHTDSNINYWGEVPINRILSEKFGCTLLDNGNEYISHRYGAVNLKPSIDVDRQLNKLIKLMFQYHGSFGTICLSCQHKLNLDREVQTNWIPTIISEAELTRRIISGHSRSGNSAALYCSCSQCGEFWVIQHCYQNHHRILKFSNCFHRHSDHPEHQGKWMYICPVCGSDPSASELGGNPVIS